MTCINEFCADIGTVNCPCPLAETGDCLVCSRLAGKSECDCNWSGVCVFNEYMQNDKVIRSIREEKSGKIIKKIRYSRDLIVIVIQVGKGFALEASTPGSFVFLNSKEKRSFYNVPISVMRADIERGTIYIALKEISAKTKVIADAEENIRIKGIYRNGFLGQGLMGLEEDIKIGGRWLIITKGVGFAPVVNLMDNCGAAVMVDIIIDTDKINQEIVMDYLNSPGAGGKKADTLTFESLQEIVSKEKLPHEPESYDKIMVFASDYYIEEIRRILEIPKSKLVFCNNFRMCCGEGICGACSIVDEEGNVRKMCKCRNLI
ncbi:MAG: hypothetical protein GX663_05000 [Clostridiales bacterium]|nr:hypothetical protein [Clostridiales bacterium]